MQALQKHKAAQDAAPSRRVQGGGHRPTNRAPAAVSLRESRHVGPQHASSGVAARYAVGGPASHDVVLSSGFLAFAQHAGFLQAVEEAGVHVGGVMGTSAGALTGSLYAAGYSPKEAAALLSEKAPIQLLQPCFEPWRGGLLSLDGVVQRLSELLPPTFEGLAREFAVGVVTADGQHVLIDQGPLPEAVAASAAIPFIFSSVDLPGGLAGLKDGGMVDRVGLMAWRQRRRQQQQLRNGASTPPCLVHVIERSSPFSGADDAEASGEDAVQIVRCPKSGVNFFDLGDFDRQFHDARERASDRLQRYVAIAQQQQQQRSRELQQQKVQQHDGSVVLGSSRWQPAAATAAAAAASGPGAAGTTSTSSSGAGASRLIMPPPSSSLRAPRSPGSAGRSSARRANEE